MSFASQAREEIARRSLQKDCCVRAAAYGIACFAKYFDASGLVLQTEQELTTQVASQLFARCGVHGRDQLLLRTERNDDGPRTRRGRGFGYLVGYVTTTTVPADPEPGRR